MSLPIIQSAIPTRRYQYGEFVITILSDIDSSDSNEYLYIAAVLREGTAQPEVYITCEPIQEQQQNTYRVRGLTAEEEHIIGHNMQWKNEQKFCEYALQGIQQMFELSDETPILLS